MIGTIVGGQLVLLAIYAELTLGYPVPETTDKRAKENPVLLIVGQCIKTQRNVGKFALSIWHLKRHDGATIIHNACLYTSAAGKCKKAHFFSRGQLSKGFFLDVGFEGCGAGCWPKKAGHHACENKHHTSKRKTFHCFGCLNLY